MFTVDLSIGNASFMVNSYPMSKLPGFDIFTYFQ